MDQRHDSTSVDIGTGSLARQQVYRANSLESPGRLWKHGPDRDKDSRVSTLVPEKMWEEWLERLYSLRRDKRGPHERPHKPVLPLTILDLLDRDNKGWPSHVIAGRLFPVLELMAILDKRSAATAAVQRIVHGLDDQCDGDVSVGPESGPLR